MNAIDTNILVYAFDSAYPQKQKVCKALIQDIFDGKVQGAVTNQILSEFIVVVTKKVEKPLSKDDARIIVESIISSGNWRVFNYTEKTVIGALMSKMPFWDALIEQTLRENGIQSIITENNQHFTIKVINPFK